MKKKVLILGGGIAGMSASYHLNKLKVDNLVFEKKNKTGGLLANFKIKNFTFDQFVHFSFAKDKYTKNFFQKSSDYFLHREPKPNNYYNGTWLEHSPQLHLYNLSFLEKMKIITSYVLRNRMEKKKIKNYKQWLEVSYGNYFTNNFTKKYTEKYWSIPLKKLETKWLKFRMPKINIIDLLMGAFTKRFKNTFYGSNLRYPKKGGYESFLRILKSNKNILTNSEVEKIEVKKNKITLKNKKIYYYKYLISTLPLIEIVKKIDKVPTKVKKSTSKLNYTSGVLVSICLNKKIKFRPWFYVYDKDIPFARAHSPSEKSRFNAPKKCSSLQLEIYFNKKNNEKTHLSRLKDKAIKSILKMNLFNLKDIMYVDVRKVEYANIIFDHNVYKAKSHVLEYLKKNNIVGAGRFGEWKYLWSNEAFLSGKNAASKVFKKIKA